MDIAALGSKMQIPLPPHCSVERERLSGMLDERVPNYELVLLLAPAGYGKTTLLSQWARAAELPVAWITLAEEDSDVERFLRLLVTAWIRIRPEVRDSRLSLLLGSKSPDIDAVLREFVAMAVDNSGEMVFVLDDYHLIRDGGVHESLTYLIDRLPATIHFVVAGRAEPPLPLAIYRARDQLLELSAIDLQFSLPETAQFMAGMTALDFDQDQLSTLHERLEGWATGLRLVALSLRRDFSTLQELSLGGKHRFIADYLTTDVFDRLDGDAQNFLIRTSLVDRLCAPLCDALTGNDQGQVMLDTLERQGLFLLALDDQRQWYRYHQLFADYLREKLYERFPDEIPELHQRAATWYLEHDLPQLAMRHAIEGENGKLVDDIVGRTFALMLHTGQVAELEGWLASVPYEWHIAYPSIAVARAGVYLYSGQMAQAAAWLDEVERQSVIHENEVEYRHAGINAMRCFIACFQNDVVQAETFADRALQEISDTYIDMRAGVYGALGDTYRRNAQWQKAREAYLALLNFGGAPTFRVGAIHVFGALADLALRQGQLHAAAGYWRRALSTIRTYDHWEEYSLPLVGWVYVRLGEILYEWNDLDEAWRHLADGLERGEIGGDSRTLISGYLAASRLKLGQDNLAEAVQLLGRADSLVVDTQFSEWIDRFQRLQLQVWLAQDKVETAMNWIEAQKVDDDNQGQAFGEFTTLGMAQTLIAEGSAHSVQRARLLLDPLLREAKGEGRSGVVVEAQAHLALAFTKQGESSRGLVALESALRLAEPEEYVRTFVDLGLPMARLLQEAQTRGVVPDYVGRLLAAFDSDEVAVGPGRSLPEPLTPREQEVLALMSAGLTNSEIADQLLIAPGTVKKHTANIYGKLHVSNRTEAVARARELNLLQ